MLRITGEEYGFTENKLDFLVDTSETFSVQHTDDMTEVICSEGIHCLKRETFKCETV